MKKVMTLALLLTSLVSFAGVSMAAGDEAMGDSVSPKSTSTVHHGRRHHYHHRRSTAGTHKANNSSNSAASSEK